MRKEINQIIRNYAYKNGGCYKSAWDCLYRQFNFQNSMNVQRMAIMKNVRPLDVVEKVGGLACLLQIAKAMFE